MSVKDKPILKLTKKQYTSLKTMLDSQTIASGFALFAKDKTEEDEWDDVFDKRMERYNQIVSALGVLGVTIEGHEPAKAHQKQS